MVKQRECFRRIIKDFAQKREDNGQCPYCGKLKSEWKRTTTYRCCSVECTQGYWDKLVIYRDWADLRKKAFQRDNHTCVKCNKETSDCNLVGDHIKPIALGGDEWDIDNIQTLCIECNKIKTAKDAKDIAHERKREKHGSLREYTDNTMEG